MVKWSEFFFKYTLQKYFLKIAFVEWLEKKNEQIDINDTGL